MKNTNWLIIVAILFLVGNACWGAELTGNARSLDELTSARLDVGDMVEDFNLTQEGGWFGAFIWCVCSTDRGRIIWKGETLNSEDHIGQALHYFKQYASLECGDCYAAPKIEIVNYGRKTLAKKRAAEQKKIRNGVAGMKRYLKNRR